jgi:hypothetical protein
LRKLKTYLGRVIRDITRKIEGDHWLETKFVQLLSLARRVQDQERDNPVPRSTSLHAPEVECIGKGKPNPDRLSIFPRRRRRGIDPDCTGDHGMARRAAGRGRRDAR